MRLYIYIYTTAAASARAIMLADEQDDPNGMERIRRREDAPTIQDLERPPSCASALAKFVGAVTLATLVLIGSCFSSCRPRLFRALPTEEKPVTEKVTLMTSPLGAIPESQHTRDSAGGLLRSTATGNGFAIEWQTPQHAGAVSEEVLDAVLSRWQSLSRSGFGSPELSQHIFQLDKLLNDMRHGEFSGLERTLMRNVHVGPGLAPAGPSSDKPSGAGFPGPVDSTPSRQDGFESTSPSDIIDEGPTAPNTEVE